ncbi:signal peptidase I [Lachnotalea glycerini]|uniref:Signal peptidase I n=1 Tax=Lachnotalea glycerini TaxID=1763509 RepID=A0A318EWD4_9FIRM|nr:signal peptidase I [Lachnotalea glycerini]PXV93850.1 signal peptidase I [Lachnotalea glycerini]
MQDGRFDLDSSSAKDFMSFLFEKKKINKIKIIGKSMEPTIMKGEVVRFENDISNLKVGDIVLFFNKDHLTTHRICEIILNHNTKYYITRGDSENSGVEKIKEEIILGKVLL